MPTHKRSVSRATLPKVVDEGLEHLNQQRLRQLEKIERTKETLRKQREDLYAIEGRIEAQLA